MIVDRLMLFTFSIIILAGTMLVTITAPSIHDRQIPITVFFPEVIEYDDE
jgi:hypothetical protein